ncbi:MAG: hypothetical protein U9R25_14545 [Chloroflexota bacterium]|nr:hypothetical protein [Chloroflexota bacterium]
MPEPPASGFFSNLTSQSSAAAQSATIQATELSRAYAAHDPNRCAIHHYNLSNHLEFAGARPEVYLAHRLAAAVIAFQTGSQMMFQAIGALAAGAMAQPVKWQVLPGSFPELCAAVAAVDGVDLMALVDDLSVGGGASGDEAMHGVIGMAKSMSSG